MNSSKLSLHRIIKQRVKYELSRAGLKPRDSVLLILTPTPSSLIQLYIVAPLEKRYDAKISCVYMGQRSLIENHAKKICNKLEKEPHVHSYVEIYQYAASRKNLRTLTPFVADDLALQAILDALNPPPIHAFLNALTRPIHPLQRITANEALEYAIKIDKNARNLPRLLLSAKELELLMEFSKAPPHAARATHLNLAKAIGRSLNTKQHP